MVSSIKSMKIHQNENRFQKVYLQMKYSFERVMFVMTCLCKLDSSAESLTSLGCLPASLNFP